MKNILKQAKEVLSPIGNILSNFFTKLVKALKTDKNTFAGVFLTAVSIFFAVDSLFELIITVKTGIGVSYYNYITQAIALFAPFLAFMYIIESPIIKKKENKPKLFKIYTGLFAIIFASIIGQILNKFIWILIFSTPNYMQILKEDRGTIFGALRSVALAVPLITFSYFWDKINTEVFGEKDLKDAIINLKGYRFKGEPKPLTYPDKITLGNTVEHGVNIDLNPEARLKHTLVLGNEEEKIKSLFEPIIGEDIKKKKFLRENATKIALELLKTKKATLSNGYGYDDIKSNFKLKMIEPVEEKIQEFNEGISDAEITDGELQDLGITYISENIQTIKLVQKMASDNNFKSILVDNFDENSFGLNPFAYSDVERAAFYATQTFDILSTPKDNTKLTEAQRNYIYNIAIMLKISYPQKNDGKIATLEDLSTIVNNENELHELINNFKFEADNVVNYENTIKYFKNNKSSQFKLKKEFLEAFSKAIEDKPIRTLLCNRSRNLDIRKAINDGSIILIALRNSSTHQVAYLTLQELILSLYYEASITKFKQNTSTIPNYLYLPDYGKYLNLDALNKIKEMSKYNIGITVGAKNNEELTAKVDLPLVNNTFTNKMIFGGLSQDELIFWTNELKENKNNAQISAKQIANLKNGKMAIKILQDDSYFVDIIKVYPLDEKIFNDQKRLPVSKKASKSNEHSNEKPKEKEIKKEVNKENINNDNNDKKENNNGIKKLMSPEEFSKAYKEHVSKINQKTRAAFLYDDEEDIDFDFNEVIKAYSSDNKKKNKSKNRKSDNKKTNNNNNNNNQKANNKKQNNNNQEQKKKKEQNSNNNQNNNNNNNQQKSNNKQNKNNNKSNNNSNNNKINKQKSNQNNQTTNKNYKQLNDIDKINKITSDNIDHIIETNKGIKKDN